MTGRQQIGPCVLEAWGAKWIAVRCPREHADLMRGAGGLWEPGRQVWLIERRRIGPVVRALERMTVPLFRQAGLLLDALALRRLRRAWDGWRGR
jgi:hypothetical protein